MAPTSALTRRRRAGGKTGPADEPADHALGRSRGGVGTKLHLLVDRHGLPLQALVSAGQAHESRYALPLLDGVAIRRRRRPRAVAGDKGYSFVSLRRALRRRHIRPIIPTRSDQRPVRTFDRAAYRERNVVERRVGWLKERRRLATRYDKLAVHYLNFVKMAFIQRYLRTPFAHRA
jgi:transposase